MYYTFLLLSKNYRSLRKDIIRNETKIYRIIKNSR